MAPENTLLASQEPDKILIVIGPIAFGGIEVWVHDLLRNINREKFEPIICSVVCRNSQHSSLLYRKYQDTGTEICEVKGYHSYDPVIPLKIARLIKQKKVCLVHSNSIMWGLVAGVLCRVPTIRHFHNSYISVLRRPLLDFFLHRLVKYYITANAAIKDELVKAGSIVPCKIRIVHCGIDLDRFKPGDSYSTKLALKKSLNLVDNTRVVTTVAALRPQKGHQFFLEMAKQVLEKYEQPVKFLVIGDGPVREQLVKLTQELNLSNDVLFLGARDDIPTLLSISDVVVISSLYEAGPITLLEAFAMHKPVVSTPVGRAPELIRDGITGFLVPTQNSEKMAQKVVTFLEQPELAIACGQRAGELALTFSNEYELRKLEDYYGEIITQARKSQGIAD